LWYGDSRLKALLFISNRRKGNKEKKIIDTGWEIKNKKKEG